jgi:hypothetical protein
MIEAQDGDLYLLSQRIYNFGAIKAVSGAVEFATGNAMSVHPYTTERVFVYSSKKLFNGMIDNVGFVNGIKVEFRSEMNPYEPSICHSGVATASGIASRNGRIFLQSSKGQISIRGILSAANIGETGAQIDIFAHSIEVAPLSSLDVSGKKGGGAISIGNQATRFVHIDRRASLSADATDEGDGGKIVLRGREICAARGDFSAKGKGAQGNDGVIQSSRNGL